MSEEQIKQFLECYLRGFEDGVQGKDSRAYEVIAEILQGEESARPV
jgi:acid stress-induced BolA-like protein IbaG/YrbA